MANEFKVDKEAVIAAFNEQLATFDDIVVIGVIKKAERTTESGTYYLASSSSAENTDNIISRAVDKWLGPKNGKR